MSKTSQYNESSIKIPKGFEPVKQRPDMYMCTDNLLHIVQEVIDSSADEALDGYGKLTAVALHRDDSVSVEDDIRSIPVGIHPEEGVSVVETVYTHLHAGGKFDKGRSDTYAFSDDLHGVGMSATNTLSTRLEVTAWRDDSVSALASSSGDVIGPLATRKARRSERKSDTHVRAWSDVRYFDSGSIPPAEL